MDNVTKPFSIYAMESDESWYIGSAWNKSTPHSRFVKHHNGTGGAPKLWEAIQRGEIFTQTILESAVAESQQDACEVEERWIHKYLADDDRICLNINLYPSKSHGWAGSPESVAKIADALRGRKAPWVTEALTGKPRPDISAASWGEPGSEKHESHRKAVAAGMAAMTDEAKAEMRQRQIEASHARWAQDRLERTHCIRGHEFTPENTYVTSTGARQCRMCKKILRAEKRLTETANPHWCDDCDSGPFKGKKGLRIHRASIHGDN